MNDLQRAILNERDRCWGIARKHARQQSHSDTARAAGGAAAAIADEIVSAPIDADNEEQPKSGDLEWELSQLLCDEFGLKQHTTVYGPVRRIMALLEKRGMTTDEG
jgi:hypothetical protein